MNKNLAYFKKIIENDGHKFTKQKESILKFLVNSKQHFNAEEIYAKVKESNIGLATVYRSLKEFSKLGIVKVINVNGINYYEMKIFSRNPLHIHFKCSKCNDIIDIDDKELNFQYVKLNEKIALNNNLDIYDVNIMFTGLCSKCREE